jgi:hypothetical protein
MNLFSAALVINKYGLLGGIIIVREAAKCSEKNLPHCYFIWKMCHMNWPVTIRTHWVRSRWLTAWAVCGRYATCCDKKTVLLNELKCDCCCVQSGLSYWLLSYFRVLFKLHGFIASNVRMIIWTCTGKGVERIFLSQFRARAQLFSEEVKEKKTLGTSVRKSGFSRFRSWIGPTKHWIVIFGFAESCNTNNVWPFFIQCNLSVILRKILNLLRKAV